MDNIFKVNKSQILRFFISGLIATFINFLVFNSFYFIYFLGGLEMSLVIIFLSRLIDNYKIAWLIGAFIGALNNYLGSKYFLFKK